MPTLFGYSAPTFYSAMEHCVYDSINDIDKAYERATERSKEELAGQDERCVICHDFLAASTGEVPKLAMVALICGHHLHEVCALQWLCPVKLPLTVEATPGSLVSAEPMVIPTDDTSNTGGVEGRTPSQSLEVNRMIELGLDAKDSKLQQMEVLSAGMQMFRQREEPLIRQYAALATRERGTGPGNQDPADRRLVFARLEQSGLSFQLYLSQYGQDLQPDCLKSGPLFDTLQLYLKPYDQELPPVSLNSNYLVKKDRTTSVVRSTSCPYCTQIALLRRPYCHSDTVQLLRIRFRLTEFAYSLLEFKRTPKEEECRDAIIKFLHRRHLDNVALDEREVLPSASDCRLIFKHARWLLRRNALNYMRDHPLPAKRQLRLMQLVTIFENFHLKDRDIPCLFNPRPDQTFEVDPSQKRCPALMRNTQAFIRDMDLSKILFDRRAKLPPSVDEDKNSRAVQEAGKGTTLS